MPTRRRFLRDLLSVGAFAAGFGAIQAASKVNDLYEQHEAWEEAEKPNPVFFQRHEAALQRLSLGTSFAPEQWSGLRLQRSEAMDGLRLAVQDLGMRQLRLGIRWQRVHEGRFVDLSPYAPLLEYCFANDVDVCLDIGPIKVFRWPEEHVPAEVLAALPNPPGYGETVQPYSLLANEAIAYARRLIDALRGEYGRDLQKVRTVQVENEPFYPLGVHSWELTPDYVMRVAELAHAGFPDAKLLLSSAGRLNLVQVRDVIQRLIREYPELRDNMVSGFDFHYRTPNRDAAPVIRHFDQVSYARPFAANLAGNIWDSRDIGYSIEITEGQMEPWGQFEQPGNFVKELRYMLLRCLNEVLDPRRPALIRLWGIEALTKRMISGDLTREHHDIIEVIQHVNGIPPGAGTHG